MGFLVLLLLLLLRSTASGQLLGSRWDWAMARIRPRSLVRSFLVSRPFLLLLLLRVPLLLLLLLLLLLQSLNLVILLLLLLLLLRRRVESYSTPRTSGDWYSSRTPKPSP